MFDMSSASGYMGETYFQEFGPKNLTCPQLVDTMYRGRPGLHDLLWRVKRHGGLGAPILVFEMFIYNVLYLVPIQAFPGPICLCIAILSCQKIVTYVLDV